MVDLKVHDPKAAVCMIVALLSAAAMIPCLLIGGGTYFDEHSKILNYENIMCKVNSSTIEVHTCSSSSNQKNNKKTKCYSVIWKVYHGDFYHILATINDWARYNSYTNVVARQKKYQAPESYSCWYDRRDQSIAQWEKPSTSFAITVLYCGFLFIILTILFTVPSIILVKRERSQRSNRKINQSDDTHIQLQSQVDTNFHS